ncbi:rab9 effector protein with kelch motifs [Amborella trichopoda]|uniref:Uncharacterized protein n=1 Tax=Amborella trichopoda TaxID=13333 RepID=W1P673_AMBTC|nr:rab9 effector protein with kelch motifs [Amborella trichopoda]ERN03111.1 hypothetical protein AMTR_s00003p00057130 [Amborella trichopoda]|eukprot:XP_006841436.1 rab9 effector protein with kelch motifs [Amborella trichopoda]
MGGGVVKKPMWLYPRVLGFNPSERWGHSACYSDGVLYVFGGCCGGLHFSDVLTLDLKTMVWSSLVTTGHQPGTRDSHSSVLTGHKMIVFGGTNGSKKINDLHMLDLRTKEWSKPIVEGNPPSPRESHTATIVNDDKLVIFGGSGEGEGNYLNDVHILDLKNMRWISPEVKGDLPAPRDSHTAVAIDNRLIVYGGDCGDHYLGDVDVLDMDTMIWSRLVVQGYSPGVRAGHASVKIGSKVFIIAGVGDRQYYKDVWVLDMNTCSWTQFDIRGQQPQGRFSHSAAVAESDIAIYGGCGEDERPLDELLILHLGADHPNGRYNVSMCKVFGKQWHQEKPKVSSFCKGEGPEKPVNDAKPVDLWREESNLRGSDAEGECRHQFLRSSDNMQAKRRKSSQQRLIDIESEQEEHSHSLSQHSSPSQSDQEQTIAPPGLSSPTPHRSLPSPPLNLFETTKNQSQPSGLSNYQTHQRNGTQKPIREVKPEQFVRVFSTRKPEAQPMESTGIVAVPNLLGAEVRGTVDGAFDSGYLMTANVNGQIFRGILFSPGPSITTREAVVSHPTPLTGSLGTAPSVQVLRPATILSESREEMQRQCRNPTTRPTESGNWGWRSPPLAARPDLHGVVLSLGGPGSGYGGTTQN